MTNITWEEIPQDGTDMDNLFRTKVPGGWLVKAQSRVITYRGEENSAAKDWEIRSSVCFVPDPEHTWLIDRLQAVALLCEKGKEFAADLLTKIPS